MLLRDALPLVAALVALALSIALLARVGRSPLAQTTALLFLVTAAWNLAELGHSLTGLPAWAYSAAVLSPWITPIAAYFAASFTGSRRGARPFVWATLALALSISLVAFAAFLSSRARMLLASQSWQAAFLVLVLGALVGGGVLLVRHLWREREPEEQLRTWWVLAGLSLFALFGSTELGLSQMRLGSVGTVVAATFLAIALLPLQERVGRWSLTLLPLAVGVVAIALAAAPVVMPKPLSSRWPVATLCAVLAVTLWVGVRSVWLLRARALRGRRFAALGQLSDQLAHDLKNPLTSLKGALQFLAEERRQGRSSDPHEALLDLMAEQVDRLTRTVDQYRRLGRLELQRAWVDIDALVEKVASLQSVGSPSVRVTCALDAHVGPLSVDPDLLTVALQNLLQNAIDAVGPQGSIQLSTRRVEKGAGQWVEIAIEDDGPGMDPRTRDRAFDEGFTTKPAGSGLGLPMVRRIVEEHGGTVRLSSPPNRKGTRVTLRLPLSLRLACRR